MVIAGIVIGVLAFLFAIAVTVWAVNFAKRGMHRSAREGVLPVSKDELENLLMQLNRPEHPFQLSVSSEACLAIQWCVADAKWIEVLGPASEKVTYNAWLTLDEPTTTVRYSEQLVEGRKVAGGGGLVVKSHASSGFELWGRRAEHRWGVRPDFSVGEVVDYQFTPADVKDLVGQLVTDNGWNFDLVLFQRHAKAKG
ncbi:MAG TPA: hypothetical protein DDZ51_11180 [Planctomycetaceae bacterium]|nr:hypothetical protein [Planctomycetaceae bacterium]